MLLTIKAGVRFDRDSLALGRLLATLLLVPEPPWWKAGSPLVITSGSDGSHLPHSKHYRGEALDLRVWGLTASQREDLRAHIETALGKKFRVLDEVDHLHAQVRKGQSYP